MSKTREERRLRRRRAVEITAVSTWILLALFANSWVEVIL